MLIDALLVAEAPDEGVMDGVTLTVAVADGVTLGVSGTPQPMNGSPFTSRELQSAQ